MAHREDIKALLQQRATSFDPTLDVSEGSAFYSEVVAPILDALGPDPLQTSPMAFVKDRVAKEYPSMALDDDEPLMDAVGKPLALVVGALSDQVLRIKQRQSLARPDLLTDVEADDLMGNWFVERETGLRPTAYVRVFYTVPTPASVNPAHRFYTGTGLNFFPVSTQTVTSVEMAAQKVGEEYYAEFLVRAEFPGEEYSVAAGAISGVDGLPNHNRVTNLASASPGRDREDNDAFLRRGRTALVERSMTSPRGIRARIRELGTIAQTAVVKYNDPEMQRDLLTGAGEGKLHLSGMGMVFGTSLLVWSGYEDRGIADEVFVQPGFNVSLHYGKILYGLPPSQSHESFVVDSVVYDSRGAFPELPNILLLRLNHDPTPTSTVSGAIPGFLPGVSVAITRPGKIRISDIPGGIQAPITDAGVVEINDGEVHIGGHHDVWLRPQSQSQATMTVSVEDEDPLVVGLSLQTFGATPTPNVVSSSDITIDWEDRGVLPGMYLSVEEGADVGVYRVLVVRQTQLVIDADLTATDVGIRFRIVDGLKLDLVQPRALKIPFGTDAPGNDLETIIGSSIVVLNSTNSLSFGVRGGDTLRILEGDDAGDYLISAFDPSGGGTTPIIDRPMSNSASGLSYQIFRAEPGVQLPLIRIPAGGIRLLDSSDQPTDISVPYALPVEARSLQTFTGAFTRGCGDLGFTMPGLGLAFENAGEACPSSLEDALELVQGGLVPLGELPGALLDLDPYPDVSSSLFELELSSIVVTDDLGVAIPGGVYNDIAAGIGDGWAASMATSALEADTYLDSNAPSDHPDYSVGARHVASYDRGFVIGYNLAVQVRLNYLAGMPCETQGILTGFGQGRNDIVTALVAGGPYEEFPDEPAAPALVTPNRGTCDAADFDDAWGYGYTLGYFWSLFLRAGLTYADVFPVAPSEDPSTDAEEQAAHLLMRLLSAPSKYSDDCLECDGYIFCVTLDPAGIFINYDLPAAGRTYVNDITDWLTKTISAFFPSFVPNTPPLVEAVDGGMRINWNRTSSIGLEDDAVNTSIMFEVCIPAELVGCCSNLFIAFPDVDLDLMLRKMSDWVQAVDGGDIGSDEALQLLREIINLLPSGEPGLCQSVQGDTLQLNSGPNAGGYVVETTYELSLDVTPLASGLGLMMTQKVTEGGDLFHLIEGLAVASALQATSNNAAANSLLSDLLAELQPGGNTEAAQQLLATFQTGLDEFTPVLKMCAVGIRGQFPVDPWQPYCEMFASGFPTVPPLPAVPTFEAELCDSYGDNTDPFDLLVDLIAWVFDSLNALGFDLPETFDVTFSEILAGVLNGMKVPYCVGARTCPGTVRLYFHEPTTMEVDAGGRCVVFYDPTSADPAQFPYDSTGCDDFWDGNALEADWIAGVLAGYADGLTDPMGGSDELGYSFADLAAGLPATYEDDVLAVAGKSYRPEGYQLAAYNTGYSEGYGIGWGLDLGGALSPATADTAAGFAAGLADGIALTAFMELELIHTSHGTGASFSPPVDPTEAAEYRAGYTFGKMAGLWSCLFTSGIGSFGTGADPVVLDSRVPTLLSTTIGSAEVLFGGDERAPDYQVLPPQETVDPTPPMDYPRDLQVSGPLSVSGNVFTPLQITGATREAPLALGIRAYADEIEIHEEVILLRSDVSGVSDTVREIVVATRNGSNIVTVLTPDVNLLGLGPAAADGRNPLRVGNLLFIEEGADAGGYTVTKVVSATQAQLDRPLVDTSLPANKSGSAGSYDVAADPTKFNAPPNTFLSTDVGKFLSIFSSHLPDNVGSYEILATDGAAGAWVTIDGSLAGAETAVIWAITEAPALAPADLEQGTELVVGRRIRVYEGAPATFSVVGVSDSLDPETANFYAWAADQPASAVFRGTKQPFRIARPGIQRISSTQMEANREGSLYYFDVLARALGTDEVHNVPAEQRFEAVFGTYLSDGYYYEVEDTNFTFSPEEKVALRLSPSFLPAGRDDVAINKIPLNGQRLQIAYENSPDVADVHRMLIEPGSRTTCANPIARHFLPAYISIELRYFGGEAPSSVAERISSKIKALEATDSLSVAAAVETALREAKASDWEHDIYVVSVTHDLDRRLVGNRSRDRIGGAMPQFFNGSNRLSYFIPGKDTSGVDEADLEPGDMIRALRVTLPLVLS